MSDTKWIRKVMFTVFNKYGNQGDFYEWIVEKFNYKYIIIGATEITEENEEEHYHVYIDFGKSTRFETIQNKLQVFRPHIEAMRTNELACYEYCTKEGLYFMNFNIEDIITKEAWKAKIESAVIEDIMKNNLTKKQLIEKYPKYALYNSKAIDWIYSVKRGEIQ